MTKIEYLQFRGLIINEFSFKTNTYQTKISTSFVIGLLLFFILITSDKAEFFTLLMSALFISIAIIVSISQYNTITKKNKLLKVLKDCFENKLTIEQTLEKPEFVEMFFKPQKTVNQFSQPDF